MTINALSKCKILWSTQSGRAKACARRTVRILREQTTIEVESAGCTFDDIPFLEMMDSLSNDCFLLLFVSTTGDGEHCDSIRQTWKLLLQKSLSKSSFQEKLFALYCLGDRAYGPQFCAAGRKLAVRLLQLGMQRLCEVGYGDDGTPNGGVFADLDYWLQQSLLPQFDDQQKLQTNETRTNNNVQPNPYSVTILSDKNNEKLDHENHDIEEWQTNENNDTINESYEKFFTCSCPIDAYSYNNETFQRIMIPNNNTTSRVQNSPLIGRVVSNERITAPDWEQDTRHLEIEIGKTTTTTSKNNYTNSPTTSSLNETTTTILPYQAGDIATVIPFNPDDEVEQFIKVLPENIQKVADEKLEIHIRKESLNDKSIIRWPSKCTLRGLLKYCADIHSLPEREDLRALSQYCSLEQQHNEMGKEQKEKLIFLSETAGAALYADYILREKRSWGDVLYDFDSLRSPGSMLSLESLLMLLPAIRPRHFSIASAPSLSTYQAVRNSQQNQQQRHLAGFSLELCVAIVQGGTPLGRSYHGLCSKYLSRLIPTLSPTKQPNILLWIKPGSFGNLPLELSSSKDLHHYSFKYPVMFIGAGTGIAPLRSLILEREAVLKISQNENKLQQQSTTTTTLQGQQSNNNNNNPIEYDNLLLFGCRKQHADYYYQNDWNRLVKSKQLHLLLAFSRDQNRKIYVQQVLRNADNEKESSSSLILRHLIERNGSIYIAGGPQMARAVKEEIIESLTKHLQQQQQQGGNEKVAIALLNKLQRQGRFKIEAWS